MICDRCGLEVKKLHLHQRVCDRLPTPAQLAKVFRANENVTVKTFRQQYKADFNFIKARLIAGGATEDELLQRARKVQSINNGKATSQHYLRDKNICQRCEVLLDHPTVPAGKNGTCGWCMAEKVKEIA